MIYIQSIFQFLDVETYMWITLTNNFSIVIKPSVVRHVLRDVGDQNLNLNF